MPLVRPASAGDLPALRRDLPEVDHAARLAAQEAGDAEHLVAWAGDPARAVGTCGVRWRGPSLPEVAAVLPDVVEVNHLQVRADARGLGAGTALLAAARELAAARGREVVGVGVGDDNPGAAALYARLGYADSGVRWTVSYDARGAEGTTRRTTETGAFLTRPTRD